MRQRQETVTVPDGGFPLHLWIPERGSGPGLLLLQEIFGISSYIRKVAEDLAGRGYVVGAPDLFWRISPGWAADHDDEGLARSLELVQRFDFATGVADTAAAFDVLAGLPEVTGGAGALGFCLGGSLAYELAARAPVAAAVSFYGSSVPDTLGLLDRISAPVQFQFGGKDPYIPREQVARLEEAVAGRPNLEVHVQEEAGHAFHNFEAPAFHHPEAARAGWRLATGFLARHLPAGS
ncbi:carboxymethylenebutenolidase [Sphaerisporangium rufum]|uniref:Carboxymethylenebutenolidase n=1 Tax=Sphaerisporangium rufum TaxID=1381558 RepID=A0A919QZU4_9ACTN|nr:dienelactone hydrolase family protein [Sphaerisporangium rufum]GII75835.1 carboxymethylenebutenolidase [Sphaerisporangium rufum]